mgnify:CR=1 FL=1|jgi:hypothetical protein
MFEVQNVYVDDVLAGMSLTDAHRRIVELYGICVAENLESLEWLMSGKDFSSCDHAQNLRNAAFTKLPNFISYEDSRHADMEPVAIHLGDEYYPSGRDKIDYNCLTIEFPGGGYDLVASNESHYRERSSDYYRMNRTKCPHCAIKTTEFNVPTPTTYYVEGVLGVALQRLTQHYHERINEIATAHAGGTSH